MTLDEIAAKSPANAKAVKSYRAYLKRNAALDARIAAKKAK